MQSPSWGRVDRCQNRNGEPCGCWWHLWVKLHLRHKILAFPNVVSAMWSLHQPRPCRSGRKASSWVPTPLFESQNFVWRTQETALVCACLCVHRHISCTHIWKPKDNLQYESSDTIHLVLLLWSGIACMCVCTPHVCNTYRGQKRVLHPLGTKVVVNLHVSPCLLQEQSMCSQPLNYLPNPLHLWLVALRKDLSLD